MLLETFSNLDCMRTISLFILTESKTLTFSTRQKKKVTRTENFFKTRLSVNNSSFYTAKHR